MSISALQSVLDDIGPEKIAVSGGVVSMTLAAVACDRYEASIVCHAVSPAVRERATRRVKAFAHSPGVETRYPRCGQIFGFRLPVQSGQPLFLLQDPPVWIYRGPVRFARSLGNESR
jgi:hypothetical protein